ncbi:hypothetical protein JCM11251_002729 [Rhodosporidiobolus azoricus]
MAEAAFAAPPPTSSSSIVLEIPTANNETISVDLTDIFTLPATGDEFRQQLDDVRDMLVQERAPVKFWVRLVEECWAHGRWKSAIEMADAGMAALAPSPSLAPHFTPDQLPLLLLKSTMHLSLSRRAPKTLNEAINLSGPIAHTKDVQHPEFGGRMGERPLLKEEYLFRAGKDLENAESVAPGDKRVLDVKAAHAMLRGRLDEASRIFERLLAEEPNHLMALMGRARILFSQRSFTPALKTYQQVLKLSPSFLPDPRIGIGLCFWMLGDKEKAMRAWERSMVVNPSSSSPSAPLLLGLSHLNASKDPLHPGGLSARSEAYEKGLKLVQIAFKKDNTSAGAGAMGVLAAHFGGVEGGSQNALKLSERLLAFADSRLLLAEGWLARARAIDSDPEQAQYRGNDVLLSYQEAVKANPDDVMGGLGVGGCFVRTDQFPHAINAYETLLRRHPKCVEALAALASIHTHLAFTFHSVSDSLTARKAAKDHYSSVLRIFSAGKGGVEGGGDLGVAKSERVRVLAADRDLWVECARLWGDEEKGERSRGAWERAKGVEEEKAAELYPDEEDEEDEVLEGETQDGERKKTKKDRPDPVDPRIRNNLGVLHYNQRPLSHIGADQPHLLAAEAQFELALTSIGQKAAAGLDTETDAALTAVTFNIACAYEARGEKERAKEAWEQILQAHPEFVEAKARLALLHMKTRRSADLDGAHILLKEALTSSPSSADLRALYTYFLIETNSGRTAREFARSTLKELSRHDLYALCASGALYYSEARENKVQSKEAQRDRTQKFTRAAEFFDKALQLSPQCAFAAQGLAIALAEGALGNGPLDTPAPNAGPGGSAGAPQPLTEQQARMRNARDALTVLGKVKESVNDASVYVNMGHCHFARDEYDKAIENYDMASKRYLHDKSSTVLWYLGRGWYHKSLRHQNYSDLQNAIAVGEKATALNPKDLANVFNMAVLKQKGFEILNGLPVEKRTSAELRSSLEHLQASQVLFQQLVDDQSPHPPYARDIVKARFSYGNSLQKRFDEILARQQDYEATEQGKLEQARRVREAEQAKRDEAERERLAQIQKQAEALAEQRKKMREEAEQWAALSNAWVDDDEDEGGKKKKSGGGGGGKKRKAKKGGEDEEESAESSGAEDQPKKKKPKAKKEKKEKAPKKGKSKSKAGGDGDGENGARKMDVDEQYDEDDEDAPIRSMPKRKGRISKNVKSAEFIESSDEDEE